MEQVCAKLKTSLILSSKCPKHSEYIKKYQSKNFLPSALSDLDISTFNEIKDCPDCDEIIKKIVNSCDAILKLSASIKDKLQANVTQGRDCPYVSLDRDKCCICKTMIREEIGVTSFLFSTNDPEKMGMKKKRFKELILCGNCSPLYDRPEKVRCLMCEAHAPNYSWIRINRLGGSQEFYITCSVECQEKYYDFIIRRCFICTGKGNFRCGRCNQALYCSKMCQKKDWNYHKNDCNNCIMIKDTPKEFTFKDDAPE